MSRRKGKAANLSDALHGVVGRLDRKSGGAGTSARVVEAWSRASGDTVARHTTGAHLKDGVLVVFVDGPAWATELSAMAEPYRLAVNQELGQDLVKAVRFNVSRKVSVEHAVTKAEEDLEGFYGEDAVESIPLTAAERAQIDASVAEIGDPGLREAVLRATVKDLEWKKGISARNSRQVPRDGS